MVMFLAMLAAVAPIAARELNPRTVEAFDRYVRLTEARMQAETTGASPFLWVDRQPPATRDAILARLARGEVVVERLETRDQGREIDVPDALLHHWLGTVLLPGATLDKVIAFVQDYGRYAEVFAPTIQRAAILAHDGDRFEIATRTRTHKIITVVIDAEYAIDYRTIGPSRVFTRSVSRNIMEVQNAGQPSERRVPVERGSGYLWRLYNYCSFEQRDAGVYEQCESISLTRDVPFGLGWIVKPFITGLPRETLEFTLGRVRSGVARR